MSFDPLDPTVTEALRALRVQIDAGLTLLQALPICSEVCGKGTAHRAFGKAADCVAQGASIEVICKQLQPILSAGERALIAEGFHAGCSVATLDAVLAQRELWFNTRQKIRAGLTYPVLIFLLACLIAPCPALFSSGDLGTYLFSSITPIVVAWMLWQWSVKLSNARLLRNVDLQAPGAPPGPSLQDRVLLSIPLLKAVERNRNLSESALLLGHLLATGMLLSKALEYAARAASNGIYRVRLYQMSRQTQKGSPLAQCLQGDPLFPLVFFHSIEVGERTGSLDSALKRAGIQAREDYVRSVEAWSVWFPRLVYVLIALFVTLNIFFLVSGIASKYAEALH